MQDPHQIMLEIFHTVFEEYWNAYKGDPESEKVINVLLTICTQIIGNIDRQTDIDIDYLFEQIKENIKPREEYRH